MKGTHLGEFEELTLLIVGVLAGNAYSVSIKNEVELRTSRKPSIGALHSALNRLENKGFIKSYSGHGTEDRGGRKKRLYEMTAEGKSAVAKIHELRTSLFQLLPNVN